MKIENKVFLLGWNDAEMDHIKTMFDKNSVPYIDKKLWRWAKVQDYADDIQQLLADNKQPVAIELEWAWEWEFSNVLSVDHHWLRSHEKASIMQILEILSVDPTLEDELIAANDSWYIPAMISLLVSKWITKPNEQQDYVNRVRFLDRKAQWITSEQEDQAKIAIANKEVLLNWVLTVVNLPHSKTATVSDTLFGNYKNLLILSGDGEVNFYGDWLLCKQLWDQFPWWRNGGSWLWNKGENAFWWWYPDHNVVRDYISKFEY